MAAKVASESEVTVRTAMAVMDAFVAVINRMIQSGETVAVNGLGTFKVVERAERKAVNPLNGEAITVPAKKALKFKATAPLLRELNATES